MKRFDADIWKDIKGYEGKYQVSYSGQIRRLYKSRKPRILTPYKRSTGSRARRTTRDRLFIGLTDSKGKRKEIMVHQIVAEHFLGKPPKPDMVPYHINKCVKDNWASNLAYIDRRTLGKKTGASSRRQPVVKINKDGEIVEAYSSAREAGRQNYMSYQTINDRCNNKVKKAFAPDGYEYAWENKEVSINHALMRIELARKDEEDWEAISRIKGTKPKYEFEF